MTLTKYVLLMRSWGQEDWTVYTSTVPTTDLPFSGPSQGVEFSESFELPVSLFGIKYVDCWTWKSKSGRYHSIAIKQEDLGVNINVLPNVHENINRWKRKHKERNGRN